MTERSLLIVGFNSVRRVDEDTGAGNTGSDPTSTKGSGTNEGTQQEKKSKEEEEGDKAGGTAEAQEKGEGKGDEKREQEVPNEESKPAAGATDTLSWDSGDQDLDSLLSSATSSGGGGGSNGFIGFSGLGAAKPEERGLALAPKRDVAKTVEFGKGTELLKTHVGGSEPLSSATQHSGPRATEEIAGVETLLVKVRETQVLRAVACVSFMLLFPCSFYLCSFPSMSSSLLFLLLVFLLHSVCQ